MPSASPIYGCSRMRLTEGTPTRTAGARWGKREFRCDRDSTDFRKGILALVVMMGLRWNVSRSVYLKATRSPTLSFSAILCCVVTTTVLYAGLQIIVALVGAVLIWSHPPLWGPVVFHFQLLAFPVAFLYVEAPIVATVFIAKIRKHHHRDIVLGVVALLGILYLLSMVFIGTVRLQWYQ